MAKNDLRLEREQRRREQNHAEILTAAEKIFGIKGYASASMDDIAREAQFSKATLYRYFHSKDQVFMEILYRIFSESLQNMIAIQERPWAAERKLKEIIRTTMTFFDCKKNLIRVYFLERTSHQKIREMQVGGGPESAFERLGIPLSFRSTMEESYNILCRIIQEGVESGEFRGIETQEAGAYLGALIRGMHFHGPLQEPDNNLAHNTDVLIDIFLNGIKSRETRQKGAS